MATTTATISLSSADITGEPLSLSKTATMTKAAGTTGLDQFTGITTLVYSGAQTATNIVAAASYADTTAAHKVYVRNASTDAAAFINLELGSSNTIMGRLYGGDWAFFPWDGTNDVDIDTSGALTIEFGVFSQSAAS